MRFDSPIDFGACPALAASREFSIAACATLGHQLESVLAHEDHGVLSVVAAGSLGRLEASTLSDVDAIVIVNGHSRDGTVRAIEAVSAVFTQFGLRAPKASGIYAQPIPLRDLLDGDKRGSLEEPPALFGSRMQLLLDGRSLYGAAQFDSVRAQVLDWYAVTAADESSWTHMFNDLSRYLHAYAVWQQFKFSGAADDGWYLRQAKFRSTRILTFAGLLFLLAESIAGRGGRTWIAERLACTPLERVRLVFDAYAGSDFAAVLGNYEALHALMSQPAVRRELIASSPTGLAEVPLIHKGYYREIHELSAELMDDLTRFILLRRDDWPTSVFRNWLL